MNKYLKSFLHRGLVFGGFGPIVVGIVYLICNFSIENFTLAGAECALAIISTYILAFLHAGASVFNQIESWSFAKSLFCHFGVLYIAYSLCYLMNSWIPFDFKVFLIFTGIFVAVYFIVTAIVVISIKCASKKYNKQLNG